MQPAADKMAEALAQVEIKPTIVPLVCNVLADTISHPDDIAKRLVEQVTGRVRWAESMTYLSEQGVDDVWEIGSGKVLSGLLRRIDRSLKATAIGTPDDVHGAISSFAS